MESIVAVRPAAESPAPRYRNDTVFRSAERLIASAARPPAGPRASRALLFLLGLACGLGLTFLPLRQWLSPVSDHAPIARPATRAAAISDPAPSRAPVDEPPRGSAQPIASSVTDRVSAPERGVTPSPVPTTEASPPRRPAALPQSGRTPLVVAQPMAWFSLASSATGIRLRGEIQFENGAPPVTVEFHLFLRPRELGGVVFGTVQFLSGPDRGGPIRLEGARHDRKLTLREITTLPSGGYNLPIIHSFVLGFPDATDAAEITGTWNFGARSGSLVVKMLPPG